MLSFEADAVQRIEKPWGVEYVLNVEDEYLVNVIRVNDGHRTSRQYHEVKWETHWLLEGAGTLEGSDDDGARPSHPLIMEPGDVHRAVGPLLILEVSTNHPDDVVRLEDDYQR